MPQYFLGLDLGSSSVKAALVEVRTGLAAATAFYPDHEAPIKSLRPGWAEQRPADWWAYAKEAVARVLRATGAAGSDVRAIGISYQMHGLVCVGADGEPLRDAIIWCDSRALPYGERAFRDLGAEQCLGRLLNSPGNFTAAKLAWVREQEPDVFARINKVMLPGDYLALRLTGEALTTASGLSEGMMWDFRDGSPAQFVLDYYGIPARMLCPVAPTFGPQGRVTAAAAAEMGLAPGTPVCYRAGDQPNNALSLGVLQPGQAAATGGTSGVVYGVLGQVNYDPQGRVNTFAHVNHTAATPRLGVLLCINGTGILNAWMRRTVAQGLSYDQMNAEMAAVAPGSDGVRIVPFGNGAERVLAGRAAHCSMSGIDFTRHTRAHLLRAAHEGIAFAFCYGMEVMRGMGMDISHIRAGEGNMFLSPVFRETLAAVSGSEITLCQTDGSVGAAKGAAIGSGWYAAPDDAFRDLKTTAHIEPHASAALQEAYGEWKEELRVKN